MKENKFHSELKKLMDEFVTEVYGVTKKFPKYELYGLTSQLRRAALSIILNYIEGYARQRKQVLKNFLEIAYESLKETKYLVHFSCKQNYLDSSNYKKLEKMSDRIGAMLWGILKNL